MVQPDRPRRLESASNSGSGLDLSDGGMRMAVWSRSMLGLPVRRPIACGRVHSRDTSDIGGRFVGARRRGKGSLKRSSTQTPEQYMHRNCVCPTVPAPARSVFRK